MKKTLLSILLFWGLAIFGFSQDTDFSTYDLRTTASKIGFSGVKNLKNLSKDDLLFFYSNLEADRGFMKQLNINSWGVCDHYKINNYDIYNHFYVDISKEMYDSYCKEINALMILDGTIKQLN